jgi:hypothetical protein
VEVFRAVLNSLYTASPMESSFSIILLNVQTISGSFIMEVLLKNVRHLWEFNDNSRNYPYEPVGMEISEFIAFSPFLAATVYFFDCVLGSAVHSF